MLNGKNINILELLFQDRYTINDISSILNLNSRTVRYNVKDINYILNKNGLKGIKKEKDIYYIEKREISKIKKLISEFSSLTFIDRRDYLLTRLLLNNRIVLSHESSMLDVTRRTLNYDLVEIKEFLAQFSITIKIIPGKGLTIEGKEENLKNLLVAFITKFLSDVRSLKSIFRKLIFSLMEEEVLNEILIKINGFLERIGKTLPSYSFYAIVSIVIISYAKNKKFEDEYIYPYASQEYYKYYNLVKEFSEKEIKVDLDPYSIHMITAILLEIYTSEFEVGLDRKIDYFLEEIQKVIDDELNITKEFSKNIFSIIRIAVYKARFDIVQKNFDIMDVPKFCSDIFILLQEMIPKIFDVFAVEDIIFLAVVIQERIDEIKKMKIIPKRIVVVDNSFKQFSSRRVREKLQQVYNVEVAGVIPSYKLRYFLKDNKNIDMIITLVNLTYESFEIPIYKLELKEFWNNLNIFDEFNILQK